MAGIGFLKGVNVALCGMKCINLNTETVKILGIHYSYYKNKRQNENFVQHIIKIENVLKVWRMRKLTILGRIAVFKS